jgi:Flp pilus assembly protein TadB
MPESREYIEFLREEKLLQRLTMYEMFCGTAERILPVKPWGGLDKKYAEAIEFSHLNITPKGAFSFTILTTLLIVLIPSLIALSFGVFTSILALSSIFALINFAYFYTYPPHYSNVFRIRASSEIVLAVVYMTISMRITRNVENAVRFAAQNLTGPLSLDLRKILWDIYTRKYNSIEEALNSFIDKWKADNEEFTEAIYLIETALAESTVKLERALDEAIAVVLNGNMERMKHYAQDLRTPENIINSMGILLPIIGLVFFPIIGIFMPNLIQPVFLVVGYDILLPIGVFWMMQSYLEKRPYTFHQPDLSKHPRFAHEKFFNKIFLGAITIAVSLITFGSYELSLIPKGFGIEVLLYSLLVTAGIGGAIIFYTIFSVRRKLDVRKEITTVEGEFAEALLQLSGQLERGMPIETAIKSIRLKIKDLSISKFFDKIVYNIETFGMTFEQAVFDNEAGAIRDYPSTLIQAVVRAIVEISRRGMESVAKASNSIAKYLKDVHTVEEDLKDILSEVTSTMQIQALLLAPLTAGIVVALTAMVGQILQAFGKAVQQIQGKLVSSGPAGTAGNFALGSIINLNAMMPIQTFQVIVGIYMMEIVVMLAMFMSTISNGEEWIMKKYTIGRYLLLATAMYAGVVVLIYLGFNSLIPLTGLIQAGAGI